ncbi:GNAT family N-acetyltransferase [Halovenus sp. WSH3]|uniref:GNAT family N-acetyltransferase n=1 Tax=Halovenus carboxidivorans TaxID=2692199 RepID=A0A6B0SYP9_9EURY|nr:GNAT family protein [Halovenus carboxidivorans]MXR50505.1 GNAT family N-acetyltransferase [Halovenus carboxidivorans]
MPGPTFIDGAQVTLRTIEEEDLPVLQRYVNDPEVWRGIGRSDPVNAEQEREFFEDVVCDDGSVQLLVCAEGEAVGTVGLDLDQRAVQSGELGYWIAPEHHNQGYGSDAAALLTEYGFSQRGCHRIEARVFEFNDASQALLESLGFREEGRRREATFIDGEYQDILRYGVLAEEWEAPDGV